MNSDSSLPFTIIGFGGCNVMSDTHLSDTSRAAFQTYKMLKQLNEHT